MAGRHLENPVKQGPDLMPAKPDGMVHGLGVPARRHARHKQGLYLRREIERLAMEGIEQRFDAKAVAGGEDRPVDLVPNHERELATQPMQALRAEIFVEMQRDLAIRAGAQTMARAF